MRSFSGGKWSLVLVLVLVISVLAGCGKSQTKESANTEKYPAKPITVIVAYGAGGGTDVGARLLLPYVEKELGVPMNVVNITGGAGWVGWTQLLSSKPDGYTIAYVNTPTLMTGYLNPQLKRNKKIEDFALIANHVIDYGAIAIKVDEKRFTNIKELIEYAKKNEVTTTSTGLGSDDHILALKLNRALGTKFVAAHTADSGQLKAGVMGGHIDAYFGNVGEVTVPHKTGELKVIAVSAPERSEYLPDVPTVREATGVKVNSWAARGLAGPKDMPKEQAAILTKAFLKAMQNPELKKKMESMGLALKPMDDKEFYKLLKEEEQEIIGVMDLLGWKK